MLFSGDMELSDMPVLGDWTISVSAHVRITNIKHTVYELKTIQIHQFAPPPILGKEISDNETFLSLCK